jgi:hypothetical protein
VFARKRELVEMTRSRLEYALAGIFLGLAALTAVVPDWIEAVFGVEPDGGNGSLEWLLVLGFGLVAVVAATLGRRDQRAAAQSS